MLQSGNFLYFDFFARSVLSLHWLLIKINFNAMKSILLLCARVFIDVKL